MPRPRSGRGSIGRESSGWCSRPTRCSGRWSICSIVTLGYVLERAMALRRDRVIPREFADRFLERLSGGKLDRERALELCRAHDSPAARVFAIVVGAWGQPGATIRQIVSYDAAGEVVELKRNLRVLSAMATLGPLLGLLGTVLGIIQSFDALGGRVGPVPRRGARPRDQPGPGRHRDRPGDRDRFGRVLLHLPQSRGHPGPRAGRAGPAGHRAGLGRGAAARADRSAAPAADVGRSPIARSRACSEHRDAARRSRRRVKGFPRC